MKSIIVLCAATLLCIAPLVAQADSISTPGLQPDTPEGRVLARLGGEGFRGAIMVMSHGVMNYGTGVGEAAPGVPFTTSTVGNVESIAKLTTVMAALRLVEDRKLSLDEPLARWFPHAPADKRAITIRQLMAHTSGMADVVDGIEDYTPIAQDSMTARLLAAPLEFPPGTKQQYSNGGYNLLAAIIARAAGRDFFDVVQSEVFARAGVTASYDPAVFPADRVAWSPINGPWVDVRTLATAGKGPWWGVWGAGSLFMSSADLARLMDAFMSGRIVRPATVRLALTPVSELQPGAMRALGFLVYRTRRGTKLVYHNGWGEYFNADLRHYPEKGITVAVLSTSRVPNALRAGREIAEVLLGPDNDPPRAPKLAGTPIAPTSRERTLVDDLLRAAETDSTRVPFIRAHMTRRLIAEQGESALVGTLARTNAPLRRPHVLDARRTTDGLTMLLESYNLQLVRLYVMNAGIATEDGALKINSVELKKVEATQR